MICYCVATPLIAVFIFYTDLGPLGIVISFLVFAVLNSVSCGVKIASLSLGEELERADWRANETRGTGSTDDLIMEAIAEDTPLTGGKKTCPLPAASEGTVCALFAVGLVFLAISVWTSTI